MTGRTVLTSGFEECTSALMLREGTLKSPARNKFESIYLQMEAKNYLIGPCTHSWKRRK